MIKRAIFIALAVLITVAILVPSMVRGEDGQAVVKVIAKMDFPATLTFDISAQSAAQIVDIRLHYTVDRMKNAEVISEQYVVFTPSKSVSTRYVIDMRQTGGMPPGSSLTYWLTVKDANRVVTETLPQRIAIEDERYNWRSIQEGMITLYWYKGDDNFARTLMDAAQDALGRLSENSGAELENPVKLYVYASSSDLRGAMIFAQEWTGGVAYTEYGIIAIGIGTSASEINWGIDAIAHELTHLVVHQVTFNPYNTIPPWLDEGLAMSSEGDLDFQFSQALENAGNNLISVRSLSSPFSAYADEAILAYAESYEIVQYLIETYGRDKMYELLIAFRNGSGYDEALEKVYGFNMESLNTQWQASFAAMK